jgi:hypothetical protein
VLSSMVEGLRKKERERRERGEADPGSEDAREGGRQGEDSEERAHQEMPSECVFACVEHTPSIPAC